MFPLPDDKFMQVMTVFFALALILVMTFRERQIRSESNQRVNEAERKMESAPEKAKPAWDLARVTLEAYFNRNLQQIGYIFWLSVMVMLVGFTFIIWGISQSMQETDGVTPAAMATVAGIITEFIGATFLFIYRSTIQQAMDYSKTLERINSVGMAMQILDTIDDATIESENNLKNKTKAHLVTFLMQQAHEIGILENGAG